MTRLIPPMLLLALAAILGAFTSRYMRNTGVCWPYLITGTVALPIWVWVVKVSPYNLTATTVVWDVVYNAAWLGTMIVLLHEVGSWMQAVGAAVVVVGLVLMGL